MNRESRRHAKRFTSLIAAGALLIGGCATRGPELEATGRRIEVERFMGDWFVLAFIPIDLPFFSEAGAHDAVESYQP